jgi:hypothetical protein
MQSGERAFQRPDCEDKDIGRVKGQYVKEKVIDSRHSLSIGLAKEVVRRTSALCVDD